MRRIPFGMNTNVFHFDTEIIIQLLFAGCHIKELPIPTYYGDEICHVNGIPYAMNCVRETLKYALTERWGARRRRKEREKGRRRELEEESAGLEAAHASLPLASRPQE